MYSIVVGCGRTGHFFVDYPEIIKSISIPTLILQGDRVPYIIKSQVTRMQEDIKNSQLIIYDDGSHFLPIDIPEKLAKDIEEFL